MGDHTVLTLQPNTSQWMDHACIPNDTRQVKIMHHCTRDTTHKYMNSYIIIIRNLKSDMHQVRWYTHVIIPWNLSITGAPLGQEAYGVCMA